MRFDPTVDGAALEPTLRSTIATCRDSWFRIRPSCRWEVALDSPKGQELCDRPEEEAFAQCLSQVMPPIWGLGRFRPRCTFLSVAISRVPRHGRQREADRGGG